VVGVVDHHFARLALGIGVSQPLDRRDRPALRGHNLDRAARIAVPQA
jgi:hypothetical protein